MADTFLGYLIACPDPACGNPNAHMLPNVVELQGTQGGLVRYTHVVNCTACDAAGRPHLNPPREQHNHTQPSVA